MSISSICVSVFYCYQDSQFLVLIPVPGPHSSQRPYQSCLHHFNPKEAPQYKTGVMLHQTGYVRDRYALKERDPQDFLDQDEDAR